MNQNDPKTILGALLEGGAIDFPREQVERARGLAQAASSATEVESLPEPLALAVLEAAVRRRDPSLPEALVHSAQRGLAKAAKKALYQLKSSGVALPQREAPKASGTPQAAPAIEELPCLLSAITGTGERALFLVRPLRGGGLESFQVVYSDEAGILRLDRGELSRGEYRKSLRQVRAAVPPILLVSSAQARALLSGAAALNLESRTPFPDGTDEALRHLGAAPKEQHDSIPPPTPEDERLALQGHLLHDEPELTPWLPPEPELRVLAERMGEVEHSPLQLSPSQQAEQLEQRVLATARAFFTLPIKRLYARRLWQMAGFFEETGRAARGELARAEARRLFHDAPGPSRFAEYLFQKVAVLAQRAQAGEEMPGPGERMGVGSEEVEVETSERRSPGGLILP